MSKVIAVASGKGGTGKSVIAASLAIGLAKSNKKTILLDLDLGMRSLDLIIGMGNIVVNNLLDLVKGRCTPEEVMIRDERYPDLLFIPAAQSADKESVTPEDMKDVIEQLEPLCDYVIIDCPSGIERGFLNSIAAAQTGILVVTPEQTALRAADGAKDLMIRNGLNDLAIVMNRVEEALVKEHIQLETSQITDVLGLDVWSVIPEDPAMIRAVNQGTSVLEGTSRAADALWLLVQKVCPEVMLPTAIMPADAPKETRKRRFGKKK